MQITIYNDRLRLTVDSRGAEMQSLLHADGTEYLWQGDPACWPDRAPVLFPYVARLTDDSYRYHGKIYHMGIHGFAAGMEFRPVEQGLDRLTMELCDSAVTRAQYPFAFRFRIGYALEGSTVRITDRVENRGKGPMYFGLGSHPGFRVPLEPGERFEDYRLEFGCRCRPDRVGFTRQLFLSGCAVPYPLENEKYLRLRHGLFDEDAVILQNVCMDVRLVSRISGRGVRVCAPQQRYLGLWHRPKSDAPYLCIEPWNSLPSRQGVVEELSCKSDLIRLEPGKTYETTWTITVQGKEQTDD